MFFEFILCVLMIALGITIGMATACVVTYKMMTSKHATKKLVEWSKSVVLMSLSEASNIEEKLNEIGG